MNWQLLAFYWLAAVMLYSAFRVATVPNVAHAALYLAVTFGSMAGLFLLLQAEFLAAVQVLVYLGAVMTLLIFALALSDPRSLKPDSGPWAGQLLSSRWGFLPLGISLLLFALLLYAYGSSPLPEAARGTPPGVKELGRLILTTYLLPFEVASVLLLAALIGALALSRSSREGAG